MDPVRPDYEGRCLTGVVRALRSGAGWAPEVAGASSVVLLVLDGMGYNEMQRRALPNLGSLSGGAITSVVPSTTPTALLSITTGLPPAEHGVIGYRINLGTGVLNVLRWSIHGGGTPPDPIDFQPREAFDGEPIPVVNRSQFRDTKFTAVQLRGADFYGYVSTAALVEHCRLLVANGERLVYAYYDSLDVVAHMHGMRDGFFAQEIAFCDRLVGDLLDALPGDAALVVTADHGHVHFDSRIGFDNLASLIAVQSGESRFRYLHARPGAEVELLAAVMQEHSSHSWVFSREQLIDEAWFGPRPPSPEIARRIGDVVVAARDAVAFIDPNNPGESRLLSGHGSLTPEEMLVPLVAGRGRA
jgi:predicted AlkP superfamily pyrophosphatase or phosphodiesterase